MRRALVGMLAVYGVAQAQECEWKERVPEHIPPPAWSEMTFDSARKVGVMYSATTQDEPGETWEWDGSDWLLRATKGPPSRVMTALVYDSKRAVCVLFGGNAHDVFDDKFDTWEWDGVQWASRGPGASPRSGHAMAYDSQRGVTVLFGGTWTPEDDTFFFDDTWEWDGQVWTERAQSGPAPRFFHSMAYDPVRAVTVLYGGGAAGVTFSDTWEWDGKTWTQQDQDGPPGPRAAAAMVYHAGLRACLLWGGTWVDQPTNIIWRWDGETWTEVGPEVAPGRIDPAMAYDSARHSVLLFGGLDGGFNHHNDTWEFSCITPCYPDFTGDGALDLFDFLAFVNAFNGADAGADCDESGSLDLFDFLCFANAFNEGC